MIKPQLEDFTFLDKVNDSKNEAMIILNSFDSEPKLFDDIWKRCHFRVCADGGANRLHDRFLEKSKRDAFIPNVIAGDLDSIRDEVKEYYIKMGCEIASRPDQDLHDLDKSLLIVSQHQDSKNEKLRVFIYGTNMGSSGRLDQFFGNVNMLYKWAGTFQTLLLIGDSSLMFLIQAGSHKIACSRLMVDRTVGIVPLGAPVNSITTKGFKWDLDGHRMVFGGLVSSSNVISDDTLEIITDAPILLTVHLNSVS